MCPSTPPLAHLWGFRTPECLFTLPAPEVEEALVQYGASFTWEVTFPQLRDRLGQLVMERNGPERLHLKKSASREAG